MTYTSIADRRVLLARFRSMKDSSRLLLIDELADALELTLQENKAIRLELIAALGEALKNER